MGPGGRGLEVTRYIGSCLISAPAPAQVPVPAGCDGLQLQLQLQLPLLSRLALHTQGAPLILAAAGSGGRRHAPRHHQQPPQHRPPQAAARSATAPAAAPAPAAAAEGAAGTASDESSGPSETSLPRIIKPRKRRKKDRKPAPPPPAPAPAPARQQPAEARGSGSGCSIVTLRPYVPLCFQLYGRDKSRPLAQAQAPAPDHQQQQQRRRPEASASAASACQCRYCDPRGRIWDVRRHGFSPVLTAPESAFASIPLFLGAPPAADAGDSDDGFFSEELPALRRSFSACSSASSSSSSSSGDACGAAPSASQGLQVSTEIVTSPNGHRDLEIRFYSCSPPAASADGAASPAGGRDAEEGDDTVGDGDGDCAEKLLGESLWANIVRADAEE